MGASQSERLIEVSMKKARAMEKKWLLVSLLLLWSLSLNSVVARDIYLVRHFEKAKDSRDPHLTKLGSKRAVQLAELLKENDIKALYSTQYHRTIETAQPFAAQSGISIDYYDPRALADFAKQLLKSKKSSLVVGHSNTTPELIALLGGEAKAMQESDYGELFKLTIENGEVTTSSVMVSTHK